MAKEENVSDLKSQLIKEKERVYEMGVRNKELENKLLLISDGVPVDIFDKVGMDILHEVKVRRNITNITENVAFSDIKGFLVQDGVLSISQVQAIESKPTDDAKIFDLVTRYLKGPNAYCCFRAALKKDNMYIVEAIDEFVVKKEQSTSVMLRKNQYPKNNQPRCIARQNGCTRKPKQTSNIQRQSRVSVKLCELKNPEWNSWRES